MRNSFIFFLLSIWAFSLAATAHAGNGNTERIRKSINAHSAEFLACYEKGGMKTGGKVVVSFTLEPNGTLKDASIEKSDLKDKEVEDCILSTLHEVDFPQSEGFGAITVSYPFVFKKK